MSRYLLCYDVHNSEENREAYRKIQEVMEEDERFSRVEKCTESVYLFEARFIELDLLKESLKSLFNFIPDLEFYVFRLADYQNPSDCLEHIKAEFQRFLLKQ